MCTKIFSIQSLFPGLQDRLMESKAESKREIEKMAKEKEGPLATESLKETIQLFLKISKEVVELKTNPRSLQS